MPSGQVHWKFVGFATQDSAPTYPSFPRTTITTIAFPDNGIFSVTTTSLRPSFPKLPPSPTSTTPRPHKLNRKCLHSFYYSSLGDVGSFISDITHHRPLPLNCALKITSHSRSAAIRPRLHLSLICSDSTINARQHRLGTHEFRHLY